MDTLKSITDLKLLIVKLKTICEENKYRTYPNVLQMQHPPFPISLYLHTDNKGKNSTEENVYHLGGTRNSSSMGLVLIERVRKLNLTVSHRVLSA